MNQIKLVISRNIGLYSLVSVGMIIIQLILMTNTLPWIDEVMFADTPIHYLSGDGWITHAWPSHAGREPMSLYMPLYQFFLTGWMWVFGTSVWASRSLNFFVLFLIGFSLIKLAEKINVKIEKGSAVILALLLWCTPVMSFMARSGRCDLVGALLCVLLAIQIVDYLRLKSAKRWIIVLLCALITMTGLQNAIYVVLVLLLGLAFLKQYRKRLFFTLIYSCLGFFAGFCLTLIFFFCHIQHQEHQLVCSLYLRQLNSFFY